VISKYGFIVKAANYDYQCDNKTLETTLFTTVIAGVKSDNEAIIVAKEMVSSGVQVIELCGGFGQESADCIISKVNTNVPIGYVIFSEAEQKKLSEFMSGETEA